MARGQRPPDPGALQAQALLDVLRQTPMRRGALSRRQCQLKRDISTAIGAQGVPPELAQRVAFQLVFKLDLAEVGDEPVWCATGRLLRREIVRLRERVGLADRQIVAVLRPNPIGVYRCCEYEVPYVPQMMIDVLVADCHVDEVVRAVLDAARTGEGGDGRIFVLPVEEAYAIRTRVGGPD
jgi:hypothetical protein